MKGISSKWKELIIFACVIMISGIVLSDARVKPFQVKSFNVVLSVTMLLSFKLVYKISAIIMGKSMGYMAGELIGH